MSAHANAPRASLDWQRVTALGTTVALHVVAVAIVAIPIAMPLPRLLPKIAEVRIFEAKPPPPALPIPPEPRSRPHQSHHPVVAPQVPRVPVATTTSPIDSPTVTTRVASASATAAPTSTSSAAAGGETRTLAYDSALRLTYPLASARRREQGAVLLRVLVDARGAVQRIEVERSSGHPQLDVAAREAVQRAHFRPVLRDGQAVPAWGIVPIEFRLDRA